MQKSFSGGELSPPLYQRTDISKYQSALMTCRNFVVLRHGGVSNRPGTQFVCEIKDSSKTVRLIPFVFSQTQAYMLEFGNQYIRVIKSGEPVRNTSQNISGITNANPCVVTYIGADNYSNGQSVYITGVTGAIGSYVNNRTFKVAGVNTGANTFQLNYLDGTVANSTSWGSYTSGGTAATSYEISSPYLEADLPYLKFVQSADVITIVHPSYAPRNLSRTSDTSWTLSTISFTAEIDKPNVITVTPTGAAGSTTYKYTVTSFDRRTSTETPFSASGTTTTGNATLSSTNYNNITWTITATYGYAVADLDFNIYKEANGVYGYIGTSSGVASFKDIGYAADLTDTPPRTFEDFNATGDYPSAIAYYQQRLCLANTDNDIEQVYASKIGNFYDFSNSSPIQSDDAILFKLSGKRINEVHHLLDLGALLMFTESGEYTAQGDAGGNLTPTAINTRQSSYNGSNSRLSPVVIGNSAVYMQARGNNVRDINYQFESSNYSGNELSIYSSHLFDDYSFLDWAYQQIPHSNLWIVRDDGALLGLTYVKEQEMLAWHRHDFENGTIENVCTIPDGTEDSLYATIKRTINGKTVRYIEKFVTRKITDAKDIAIVDCHLSYDGRNTTATTMTLSGSGWTYTDTLTLTASSSFFSASDVGNQIHVYDTDGTFIRFTIDAYTSGTVVTGRPNRTVPATLQSVAISEWSRAVDVVSGLWHLEGETVSIYADALVVSSPHNSSYTTVTVSNGSVTLSEKYSVIYIGIPITSDLQTLNIDQQDATMVDRNKLISKVTAFVQDSRGIWAGTAPPDETVSFVDGLTELKIRETEDYDAPVELKTDAVDIITEATWNKNGRVFIRQIDPIPVTILSITPSGLIPFSGTGGK